MMNFDEYKAKQQERRDEENERFMTKHGYNHEEAVKHRKNLPVDEILRRIKTGELNELALYDLKPARLARFIVECLQDGLLDRKIFEQ